jgi:hypothetical protein
MSRPTRTSLTIAIAIVVVAVVVPVAAAAVRTSTQPSQPTPVQRVIAQERGRHGDPRIFGTFPLPAPQVEIVQVSGGFDWGDAGVGGAATLALVLLVAGGAALRRASRSQEAHG